MDLDGLPRRAAPILREALGCPVVLSDPVVLKEGRRCRVARCHVRSDRAEIPSVIVKEVREEPSRGFSEWASLAFLSGLPRAREIVPRFYGGDVSGRLFLLEDLGEGRSLQDFLAGSDPAASRAALRALAARMGRLHAATRGGEDAFEAIRASLPGTDGLGCAAEADAWLASRGKLLAWFEAWGCAPPAGFGAGLEAIAGLYRRPEGFLAMTHGDPAPTNNHFAADRARLLDFEYGGFRHALYDATAWTILCPLPRADAEEVGRGVREELARACPEARDEERFARDWAFLCAYRALAMLTWMPPGLPGENRPWVGDWTMREAALVAMARLERVAGECAELAAVGEAAGTLVRAMRQRWPGLGEPEGLPRWPGLAA